MDKTINKKNSTIVTVRPPIVVVMGHIDHGKTKILDWYRKTKVVESESGGITQHIGAYEVVHKGKKITFIDTPGHEAFSKMRSRGAKVADIAILVVAADEGVKPQTREAIEIIRENNLPFAVALNKSDKPEANPARVKQELSKENVLVEEFGGKVPVAEISAKEGRNMDALLEIILILAELEELKSHPEKPAEGVVIEAHRDPQRGTTSTFLIIDGSLKVGDAVAVGRSAETIKILEDFRGKPIRSAGPSSPVVLAGLSETPVVGDTFKKFESRKGAEEFIESLPQPETISKKISPDEETRPVFNLIVKADVAGSKEVLEESLKKLESKDIGVKIVRSEIGDINESDIQLALATKLVTVVGFKVRLDPTTRELAQNSNIHILTGEVIYELIDEVKKRMEEMIPPEIKRIELGTAKILKVFKKDGARQIIGGRVEEGFIEKQAKAEIRRNKNVVGEVQILDLQRDKVPADKVEKGSEFGLMLESKTGIEEGDVLQIFKEEVVKIKL